MTTARIGTHTTGCFSDLMTASRLELWAFLAGAGAADVPLPATAAVPVAASFVLLAASAFKPLFTR